MVSGGSVGPEGEGDPAVAAERDEAVVAPAPARELVVGYALTSKKAKSFLQPKLRGLARYCGGEPLRNLFVALRLGLGEMRSGRKGVPCLGCFEDVRIACIGGQPFGVAFLDVGLAELDR